jgi:hypothetical protein
LSLDPATLTQMDSAVAHLKRDLLQAQSDFASNAVMFGAADQSNLDNAQLHVDNLTGDLYQGVVNGTVDSAAWFDAANTVEDELSQLDSNIVKYNFTNTALGVAENIAQEAKHAADSVSPFVAGAGVSAFIIAIVAVLALLWILSHQGGAAAGGVAA